MRWTSLCLLLSCSLLIEQKTSTCGNGVVSLNEICYTSEEFLAESFATNVLRVADLDLDNDIDIVTLNFGLTIGFVSIFLNNGEGSFTLVKILETPQTPSPLPEGLLLVDLTDDGAPEIVTANAGNFNLLVLGNSLSVFLNNGDGDFSSERQDLIVGDVPALLATTDFNNDQINDLVVINFGSDDMSILLNDGTGQLGLETRFPIGGAPFSVVPVDIDKDQDQDLMIGDIDGFVSTFNNEGTGQFVLSETADVIASELDSRLLLAEDFDNDEVEDLLFTSPQSGGISLMKGLEGGRFGEPVVFLLNSGANLAKSADMNQDGFLDIVVGGTALLNAEVDIPATVSILLGDGVGGFLNASAAIAQNTLFALDLGDLNGDSLPDIIFADESNFDAVKAFLSRP
jgi:hypothetical protein